MWKLTENDAKVHHLGVVFAAAAPGIGVVQGDVQSGPGEDDGPCEADRAGAEYGDALRGGACLFLMHACSLCDGRPT